MSSETLALINRIASERQGLWRLAGKGQISAEGRARIDQITNELTVLWDRYRRELVAETTSKPIFRSQLAA